MVEIFHLPTIVLREFTTQFTDRDPTSCLTICRIHAKFVSTGPVADRPNISQKMSIKVINCAGGGAW